MKSYALHRIEPFRKASARPNPLEVITLVFELRKAALLRTLETEANELYEKVWQRDRNDSVKVYEIGFFDLTDFYNDNVN